DLIDRWDRDRQAEPDRSRIILTHTNAEVRALNEGARERMRDAGDLGEDVRVAVERGARSFASGDRVMFLQNERGLGGENGGVKNGTLGSIVEVSPRNMIVHADDGRSISFDLKDYDRIDHGYAATIHKAQGMTVDQTHVLATPGMDAHGSYVALSRHRDGMDLHYGHNDFAGQDRLARTLSRDRAKDMASDYEQIDPARNYAERRGITFRARVAEIVRKVVPEKVRGMFDGLRLPADGGQGPERAALTPGAGEAQGPVRESAAAKVGRTPDAPERAVAADPEAALRKARTDALIRHARAVDAIFGAQDAGGKQSPDQLRKLSDARKAFEKVRPHGWRDAEAAYVKEPGLAREAGAGKVNRAIRALQLETEIRTDPSRRADRFVERWQKLDRASQDQYQAGDMSGYKATRSAMGDMAKSLERDPQMESLLANRKAALGIDMEAGRRLGAALALSHGLDLGRGRGIGI
ncbi:MAG TPA: Ti-type conjugative transfer relaxase TraA, partial [Aurantimonas coralicida]|nr:Ti-type conjugative transfer relaxase TraA [Aurantimonas coralicida]HEU00013.1 Ti-type conjugative transfer relaxase TraA [Aurantimonas coralicida]